MNTKIQSIKLVLSYEIKKRLRKVETPRLTRPGFHYFSASHSIIQ